MTGRRLSWLALAALLGVVLFVASNNDPAAPSLDARADRIAAELRCPVCQGLSVQDSDSATARSIRDDIRERLERGASDAEVREAFVDRYGEWILLRPEATGVGLVIWAVPIMAVVIAVAGLGVALRRSRAVLAARPGDHDLVARALDPDHER